MRKSVILFSLIGILVVLSRVLPHPANVSPISSLLLLTSLIFKSRSKLLLFAPILGLIVSDLFLGMHSTMVYVYGSYILIALIGYLLREKSWGVESFGLPIVSSLLFYTITNFGVWVTTTMYSKDIGGLLQSFWMGIPFLKMTMVGDLFFFCLIYALSFLRRQESRQSGSAPLHQKDIAAKSLLSILFSVK